MKEIVIKSTENIVDIGQVDYGKPIAAFYDNGMYILTNRTNSCVSWFFSEISCEKYFGLAYPSKDACIRKAIAHGAIVNMYEDYRELAKHILEFSAAAKANNS